MNKNFYRNIELQDSILHIPEKNIRFLTNNNDFSLNIFMYGIYLETLNFKNLN